MKEEYYIILAKKKLELTKQNIDKWAEDQKEPLTEYLQQKENNNFFTQFQFLYLSL